MEKIRDRGNSEREALQIQEVIRGLQIERTDIAQLGYTVLQGVEDGQDS